MKAAPLADHTALTKKQALYRDRPIWAASKNISVITRKSPLRKTYDVIIVGAGISGALMAHALAGKGLRLLVVDRRVPVTGSSLASTSMIMHEIDVPLHVLAKSEGEDVSRRVWQRSARAVMDLGEVVKDLKLACSYRQKHSLFLAGETYGGRALRKEVEARCSVGIKAHFLDANDLERSYGINRSGAIKSSISASANPAQLTAGILRNAKKRGAEIVSGIEIKDVHDAGSEVLISTAEGRLLCAKNVVFCTGYEFLESLANKHQKVISTWALASKPNLARPTWLDNHLVWEASDPYLYFRSIAGRVIVGGEDEKGEEAYKNPMKAKEKTSVLVEKIGDLTGISFGKPDFVWSAAFAVTSNGLPMIGKVPGMKNVFVAMGYGGNGITFSQIAADIISSEIVGRRDPDWNLFPVV